MDDDIFIDKLDNVVMHCLGTMDDKELRLTVFLIKLLQQYNRYSYLVLLDELINGIDDFSNIGRVRVSEGIGLTRRQILNTIHDINARGILYIQRANNSNDQLMVKLNLT